MEIEKYNPKDLDYNGMKSVIASGYSKEILETYLSKNDVLDITATFIYPKVGITEDSFDTLRQFIKRLFQHPDIFSEFLVKSSSNGVLMTFVTHPEEDVRDVISLAILRNSNF